MYVYIYISHLKRRKSSHVRETSQGESLDTKYVFGRTTFTKKRNDGNSSDFLVGDGSKPMK